MVIKPDQHQIITQVRSGEDNLLEAAAGKIRQQAISIANKIVRLGGGRESDIQSILNDTVLAVIDIIRNDAFELNSASLDGLIYVIIKNKWMSELKRRYRSQEIEKVYQGQGELFFEPVENKIFTEEERQQVRRALQQLNVTDRELIEQKYMEGISLKVIAERLGISEDAVKKRHERVKNKLRAILGKDPRIED
ncbi:MAG: sigma-70 family RNA polymerase sigma factor [Saprospiraceae bacterium]